MASLLPHRRAVLASTVILATLCLLTSAGGISSCHMVDCGPGTCMSLPDSYQCMCPLGYTGSNCEILTCDLCENGASCDEMTSECVCAAGYTGSTCSVSISSCDNIDCGAGFCVASGQNYSCDCLSGYTGANCDEILFPCDSSPCQNGGSCMEVNGEGEVECQMNNCSSPGDFTCSCLPEYTGQLCATQLREYYVHVLGFSLTFPPASFVSCNSILSPTATCEYDGSAGVEWEETVSRISLYQPCQSVDMSLRGTDIVRLCSEEGQWNELDFSQCTIEKGAPPFLLLWVLVVAEGRGEVDSRRMAMENEVCIIIKASSIHFNNPTFTQHTLNLKESTVVIIALSCTHVRMAA